MQYILSEEEYKKLQHKDTIKDVFREFLSDLDNHSEHIRHEVDLGVFIKKDTLLAVVGRLKMKLGI